MSALENRRYFTLRQNWAQDGNSNRPTTRSTNQTDPLPAGSMGRPVLDEHLSASRTRGSGVPRSHGISRVALAAFLGLRCLVVAPRLMMGTTEKV
jgi:hypothetical protein